ncbi:MAG TPA: hypothetical protein VFI84_00730 [Candidatus Saccharimonadales bacterium]|nr:hypothetical protein [Candidatus Saccharimonadales bacterium]
MKHYVIYVPGLGDNKYFVQGILVYVWRLYGVRSATRTMNWLDPELFEEKLTRLLVEVDEKLAKGYNVSLVGASAGAGAVLNAYAARKGQISGVVSICGKILHAETVSDTTYRRNPAFKESMDMLPANLNSLDVAQRSRILSLHPKADPSVPVKDTFIEGAHEKTMLVIGHTVGILTALSLYGPQICKFLKQQAGSSL